MLIFYQTFIQLHHTCLRQFMQFNACTYFVYTITSSLVIVVCILKEEIDTCSITNQRCLLFTYTSDAYIQYDVFRQRWHYMTNRIIMLIINKADFYRMNAIK